jgi:hypothetical protein
MFGVKIEVTRARSTPGMKNTSSVSWRRVSSVSGVYSVPSRACSETSTVFAPPKSL